MPELACPSRGSQTVVKNGFIHNGKQNRKCRVCGRQFVEDPQQKRIEQNTKNLIDKLLLEKIPLAGITRVCDVSDNWLQEYVSRQYANAGADGLASYPRAIREELGEEVERPVLPCTENAVEQSHTGIKHYYPMLGFGEFEAANRFCQTFDEVANGTVSLRGEILKPSAS